MPLPKPDLLVPKDLDQNTGTAAIFRLQEVRKAIQGDFIVLPCDLVCEVGGETLLEAWMIKEGGLGGATGGSDVYQGPKMAVGGEKGGRRGGLSVYYETKGETVIKGEETDFIATTPLEKGTVPSSKLSILDHVSKLVYSTPTDTLKDITEEKKSFPIRHGLINAHPRVRMLGSHRDAHIYVFPAWVLDMINSNEELDSLGEDVLGYWAKAGWQKGLGDRLGLREIFITPKANKSDDNLLEDSVENDNVDLGSLSSTWISKSQPSSDPLHKDEELTVPPILAYVQPKTTTEKPQPLIRRVDTAPLLLATSLHLAKLEAHDTLGRENCSPLAHASKVAYPEGVASRTTISKTDSLLADYVTVEEKSSIKECVIGANCVIKTGAKLLRCVLMDGVVVGKGCRLTGCILGKRSEIGEESTLTDCEVQENLLVEPGSKFIFDFGPCICICCLSNLADISLAEDKNNKLMSSEGMEATEQEFDDFVDEDEAMVDDDDLYSAK